MKIKGSHLSISKLKEFKKGHHQRNKTFGHTELPSKTSVETPDFSPYKEADEINIEKLKLERTLSRSRGFDFKSEFDEPGTTPKNKTSNRAGRKVDPDPSEQESDYLIYQPRNNRVKEVSDEMHHGEILTKIEFKKKELDKIYGELQQLQGSLDKKESDKVRNQSNDH